MLQKAKDFITWGEVSDEMLAKMIISRGKLVGDKPIDDAYIGNNSKYGSIKKEFAMSVVKDEIGYSELKDVKPIFRLHPPRKGWGRMKKDLLRTMALWGTAATASTPSSKRCSR